MPKYKILFAKQAQKDIKKMEAREKVKLKKILLEVISETPFLGKKLVGKLAGNYSYRLSIKDRLVYSVDESEKIVYVKRARTHYGE